MLYRCRHLQSYRKWVEICCYSIEPVSILFFSVSRPWAGGQRRFEEGWRQTSGRTDWMRRPSAVFDAVRVGQIETALWRRDSWCRQWSGRPASAAVWNVKLQYYRSTPLAIGLSSDFTRQDASAATTNSGINSYRAGTLLAASRWAARPADHRDWGYAAFISIYLYVAMLMLLVWLVARLYRGETAELVELSLGTETISTANSTSC